MGFTSVTAALFAPDGGGSSVLELGIHALVLLVPAIGIPDLEPVHDARDDHRAVEAGGLAKLLWDPKPARGGERLVARAGMETSLLGAPVAAEGIEAGEEALLDLGVCGERIDLDAGIQSL